MRAPWLLLLAALAGGCATGEADATGVVAVVPTTQVTVHAESFVTNVDASGSGTTTEPATLLTPLLATPLAPPPDPGCVPDDTACLEAACARGSGHGCEARADLYGADRDLHALDYYGRAFRAYRDACKAGNTDACADETRLAVPGYKAHSYISEPPGCPEGYVMTASGCVVPGLQPGPIGTTVIVNGDHNVVQVFGGAAKVTGKAAKKTP